MVNPALYFVHFVAFSVVVISCENCDDLPVKLKHFTGNLCKMSVILASIDNFRLRIYDYYYDDDDYYY